MRSVKCWTSTLTICTLALSMTLVGCGKNPDEQAKEGAVAAQQAPPLPQVGVLVAQPENVERTVELTGRTAAYQVSEVRPQTSGVILKRLFTEGSYVRAGQALYEIDDRTNRATVESANASIDNANASIDNAKAAILRQEANIKALRTKEGRYRQLVDSDAVSKQEYDDIVAQIRLSEADLEATKATLKNAQATLKNAQASLKNAQITLGYSTVRAPISGQSSRSSVTAGALVTASQPDPLVTIQQLDPIYVDIQQSSAELLRLRQQLSQGKLGQSSNTKVQLKLENGDLYPIEGSLAFSDASVDPDTGSVTLRAVFDNPSHLLLPGMFATAQIVQGVIPNAFLIPQSAVSRTPTGQATILITNPKGVVETRMVTTVGVHGQNWIVTEGLQAGDKVIVDGVAKVKEGQTVKPTPFKPNDPKVQPNQPDANAATTGS